MQPPHGRGPTSQPDLPSYSIVSPVRDEAAYFRATAESLVAQTHRPLEWVIVDDGSTDSTPEIARAYADEYPWIDTVELSAPPGRHRGGRVVQAFEAGRARLRRPSEIIVKLDGDLLLPPHYFAWVCEVFARAPRAGLVGGVALGYDGTRWAPERSHPDHVRGCVKAYRVDCLEDIGGLRASMGWDGIDEYGARARGWEVHVLSELPFLHCKPVGSKQAWSRARWEEGVACHWMGFRWDYFLAWAAARGLRQRPRTLSGLVMVAAFARSRLVGAPRIDDPLASAALRAEQRRRIAGALRRTPRRAPVPLPDRGPAFWAASGELAVDPTPASAELADGGGYRDRAEPGGSIGT
jgi:poly-beta-1,6-N-acetyl-D-glucosamine synthase